MDPRNGRDFDVGGPARYLKMAITFIPLVPQKTVKYKSCSYWCPETFLKVWQGLKIDILEFILKKLFFRTWQPHFITFLPKICDFDENRRF